MWNLSNHAKPNLAGATPWGYPHTVHYARRGGAILVASVGPDRVEDVEDGTAGGAAMGVRGLVQYDPTNGTVSWGDIYYGLPGVGFELGGQLQP